MPFWRGLPHLQGDPPQRARRTELPQANPPASSYVIHKFIVLVEQSMIDHETRHALNANPLFIRPFELKNPIHAHVL